MVMLLLPISLSIVAKAKAATASMSASVGTYFSEGHYGRNISTEVTAIPIRISYKKRATKLSMSTSWLKISGPVNALFEKSGLEFESDENTATQTIGNTIKSTRTGIGDTYLSVEQALLKPRNGRYTWAFGADLKIPTASYSDNIGTGEKDFALFTNGSWRKGRDIFSGKIGYQWMGDTDTTDYQNRFYLSAGVYRIISRQWGLGSSLYYKQSALSGNEGIRSLKLFTAYTLPNKQSLVFNVGKGFSDNSSDYSLSLQLRMPLN